MTRHGGQAQSAEQALHGGEVGWRVIEWQTEDSWPNYELHVGVMAPDGTVLRTMSQVVDALNALEAEIKQPMSQPNTEDEVDAR